MNGIYGATGAAWTSASTTAYTLVGNTASIKVGASGLAFVTVVGQGKGASTSGCVYSFNYGTGAPYTAPSDLLSVVSRNGTTVVQTGGTLVLSGLPAGATYTFQGAFRSTSTINACSVTAMSILVASP
jgi:hypothetical protein